MELICLSSDDEQGALWLNMLDTLPEPDSIPGWIQGALGMP
jgi:hypothetical protein